MLYMNFLIEFSMASYDGNYTNFLLKSDFRNCLRLCCGSSQPYTNMISGYRDYPKSRLSDNIS